LLFAQWAGLSSLREIVVVRSDHDQPVYLLTNDPQPPAVDIAQLYKQRWNIELLFKWLKQNLKIRRFLGRSENAVRIQIYGALIAFMLLRVLHHTAAQTAPLCCSRTSNSACSAPSISANSTRPLPSRRYCGRQTPKPPSPSDETQSPKKVPDSSARKPGRISANRRRPCRCDKKILQDPIRQTSAPG
jgi:Transposase DDE domain